ncbi:MAG TPA: hypothetical protein VIQ31_07880, partial [Phormidium sp.]
LLLRRRRLRRRKPRLRRLPLRLRLRRRQRDFSLVLTHLETRSAGGNRPKCDRVSLLLKYLTS